MKQDGNSTETIYPLFTYGDEMLLYLKEPVVSEDYVFYWIPGAYTTIVDVVNLDDEKYFCDRMGILTRSYYRVTGKRYKNPDKETINRLIEEAQRRDPVVASIIRRRQSDEYSGLRTFIITEEEMIETFGKD